jgi:hypothetical protein
VETGKHRPVHRLSGSISNMKPKRPRDPNQLGKSIIDIATGEAEPEREKNAAAVELGRKGGLRGGKARAESLSAKKRSAIAKQAARTRWGKD